MWTLVMQYTILWSAVGHAQIGTVNFEHSLAFLHHEGSVQER
jgi:hypothetical protein